MARESLNLFGPYPFIFVFRNPQNRCMMGTKVGKVRVRPQKHNRIHKYPWTCISVLGSYGIFSLRAEMDGFLKNPNRPCPFLFSEVRRFHCGNIWHCKKRDSNHCLYAYPWSFSFMESFMVVVDISGHICMGFINGVCPSYKPCMENLYVYMQIP